MKKILFFGVVLITTVILTGCGGTETLSCIKEDKSTMGKTVTKMEATFEGNKTTKVDLNVTMTFKDKYKSYKDKMMKAFETNLVSFKDKDGVEIKTDSKDSEVSVNVIVDTTKIKDSDAKDLFGFSTETKQSKADTKKSLENKGYTCK